MNGLKARTLEAVHTHTHTHTHTSSFIKTKKNKLYLENISFINYAKKHTKIDKDRLCSKVKNKLLKNSLSFLCALEVISTKDKYA